MVAFSGFYESHEPPPLGDVQGIAPLHRDGYQNGQQSGYMFIMIVALALGDALRIAPVHRHGHRNGPRRRCIRSPPPPISVAVIIAKDNHMVH
jgi:hypothetical protein